MRNSLVPRRLDVWDPFESLSGRWWGRTEPVFIPDVDVREEKDQVLVHADIPGIKKEDLEVSVHEDLLTLKGERKESVEKKEKDFHRSERFYGSFERTVQLPAAVKAEGVKAAYRDGVLEVRLPKLEGVQAKDVKIQIQ